MIFALLTLLAALAVAAVTEWFSVVGIMAIYAGAAYNSALIMGLVLGSAKLVTISWLYRNWEFSSWKLKIPLIYFTIALMTASSIGVYGFLTKAHLEQGAATVDNSAKVERLDQQIAREKSLIADNEKVIGQLDAAINSYLGSDKTDRALSVRRAQAPQRKQLKDEITAAQKAIDGYSDERLKLTSQVRAMQLEVGPIKYIADLFYGSSVNDTLKIESAIRIFTLLIVSTLDPLAVILLIAANHTLLRLQREKKEKAIRGSEVQLRSGENLKNEQKEVATPNISREEKIDKEDISATIPTNNIDIQQEHIEGTKMDEEIPTPTVIEDYIDENKTTFLEEVKSTPPPVVRSPSVSRVAFDNASEDKETFKIEIPKNNTAEMAEVQVKTPWAAQATVLAEMLGNNPHFIPQKINEKTQKTSKVNIKDEDSISSPIETILESKDTTEEEIKTLEEKGQEQIQEESKETSADQSSINGISITGNSTITGNKYPKALSWLKEFKGN